MKILGITALAVMIINTILIVPCCCISGHFSKEEDKREFERLIEKNRERE